MHTLHAALGEPDLAEPFLPPPNRHAPGDMPAGTSAGPKPAGWSNIRHISAQLFKKNPNAYFYRHTEPGVVCVWRKRNSTTCQSYFVVGILVWISLCQPASCSIDIETSHPIIQQPQHQGEWSEEEHHLFLKVSLQFWRPTTLWTRPSASQALAHDFAPPKLLFCPTGSGGVWVWRQVGAIFDVHPSPRGVSVLKLLSQRHPA